MCVTKRRCDAISDALAFPRTSRRCRRRRGARRRRAGDAVADGESKRPSFLRHFFSQVCRPTDTTDTAKDAGGSTYPDTARWGDVASVTDVLYSPSNRRWRRGLRRRVCRPPRRSRARRPPRRPPPEVSVAIVFLFFATLLSPKALTRLLSSLLLLQGSRPRATPSTSARPRR